ncbi:ralBP1-associated Eps domain-containing protein 1-like [Styela clava]
MTTGTPRQAFLKSQTEGGKAWMSFEESPIHSAPPKEIPRSVVRQDEGWTSFSESAVISVNQAGPLIASPAPASYTTQSRPDVIPSLHQGIQPSTRLNDEPVSSRTGIGLDLTHNASQAHPAASHRITHPGTQPLLITHGPGSTISHILRNQSSDNDNDSSFLADSHDKMANLAGNDEVLDSHNKINSSQQKHIESHQSLQKRPSGDAYYATDSRRTENVTHDPWYVTEEQGFYYRNQFESMQPQLHGKIDGQTARNFFTKSRLPIPELSHIWELCDMDQDGHLTLLEFCAAFHLVVARKNGYELPAVLPKTLLPPLMKMCGIGEVNQSFSNMNVISTDTPDGKRTSEIKPTERPLYESVDGEKLQPTQAPMKPAKNLAEKPGIQPQITHVKREDNKTHWNLEKWETFSDRTSSSTNLANFDQSLDHADNSGIVHPVALRVTPSKHEMHTAKMSSKVSSKSTDDEDHHAQGLVVPPSHKSLTNPYGSLKNDTSEPDSHASPRRRSSSNSSHSSTGTSDRSLTETDKKPTRNPSSDQEYQSDWSSRPLQPRSGSDSSMESSSMETSVILRDNVNIAPTPPPRPTQLAREAAHTKVLSDSTKTQVPGPTPPPRPHTQQQPIVTESAASQSEEFADFSQFENSRQIEESVSPNRHSPASATAHSNKQEGKDIETPNTKPTPAPRHSQVEKQSRAKDEKSPEKATNKKGYSAPTKPPRTRIQSADLSIAPDRHTKLMKSNSVATGSSDIPIIIEKPHQEAERSKNALQQSIRDLKLHNSKLTKLNADLQQELKDVMQSRITVEMSIHQLRPFSQ